MVLTVLSVNQTAYDQMTTHRVFVGTVNEQTLLNYLQSIGVLVFGVLRGATVKHPFDNKHKPQVQLP